MKTRYIFFSAVLTVALTLPLFGQHKHDDMTKTDMKKHDLSSIMGKPKVDATVEGLHMKVWLITQRQHKQMMKGKMDKYMKEMKHDGMGMKDTSMAMNKDMKGMKHNNMRMDNATKEAMMVGTHCIILDVTDATSGKEIDNANAKVVIVSPSKMNSSFDLKPMMSHFGVGLTLSEKGKYNITLSVNVNGVSKSKELQYVVK
jgi:hypothetical protein